MQSGVIFDNFPMDRRDFVDGLADLERVVEAARDDVLDILVDGDEVTGKELETSIRFSRVRSSASRPHSQSHSQNDRPGKVQH